MTVLVTGGGGFVGLNLAQALLAQGRGVVLFGVSMPPQPLLDRLTNREKLRLEHGDVCDRACVVDALERHAVTHIVHGAAITAALERETREAARIVEVNLIGAINVFEAGLAAGVRRIVHLGSGSVYGSQVRADGFLDEESDIAVPDSIYGITKLAAERVALRYRATRGLDVAVARLGVVFGPWEYDTGLRDTLSIPHVLLRLAQNGEEARILNRIPDDWVHAADVARALVALIDAPELAFGVYHVSAGRRWDVADWCQALGQRFPAFSWRFVTEAQDANVGKLSPVPRPPFAIARIMSELGWKPAHVGTPALDALLEWHAGCPRAS